VGSETLKRIRIWNRSGKNHSGSEFGQLRIRKEFEVKLHQKQIKFDKFSTKMLNLKTKKISLKSLYLVTIFNLTHIQDENTEVKFMLRIVKKIYEGSETN
jgi:hypothetical protein